MATKNTRSALLTAARRRKAAERKSPATKMPTATPTAQPSPARQLMYKAKCFGGSFGGLNWLAVLQYYPANPVGARFWATHPVNLTEEEVLSGIERNALSEAVFKYTEYRGITDALRLVIASRPEERRRKAP